VFGAVHDRIFLAIFGPIEESDAIGDDFGHTAFSAVLGFVTTHLESTFYSDQAALGQVIAHCLAQFSPSDAIYEISFPVALGVGKRAIHGDGKRGHRDALWGITEFGIPG
jgi:hypothetical protein